MNVQRVRALVLALLCGAAPTPSAAQITFDFAGFLLGTPTPFSQTVENTTATFSSALDFTGAKFSVQSSTSTMLQLSLFSGSYLYPNSLAIAPLTVRFSRPVGRVTLTFATVEDHIASSLHLQAFLGSAAVGAVATPGAYLGHDSYPQGTITFDAAIFDRLELQVPLQGTEPAVAFLVDTIIATPALVPPTGVDDAYATGFNTALDVAAPGVLANDDTGGDEVLTAVRAGNPVHGTLTLNADGSFAYAPAVNYFGADSFTYRPANAAGPGDIARVSITVAAPALPSSSNDNYSAIANAVLTVAAPGVLHNDSSNGGGSMAAALASDATHGTVTLNADGSFSYTPATNYIGTDSFTYRAANLGGQGNVALVTITVIASALPTSADDYYATAFNTVLNVGPPGVLANDLTNGGGAITATLVSEPSHGTLTLAATGGFTYTANADYIGVDSFTYRAVNSIGSGNVVTVTITIGDPTDPQAPRNFVVSSATGNVVTFRWTTVAAGPEPTDFVIEGGVAPAQVLASLATGSVFPIATMTVPSGHFFVRVHQISGNRRSAASNEVEVFVNTPAAPSTPSGLVAVVSGSLVELAWRQTFAGGTATQIIFDVAGSLHGSVSVPVTDRVRFPAVPTGTYSIAVRAANPWGVSAPTPPVIVAVPSACSGVPNPPDNFLFYTAGGAASAVWEPASQGPAATEYLVSLTGPVHALLPTPLRALSGVLPSGAYSMTVAATNACGASAPTAAQSLVVP